MSMKTIKIILLLLNTLSLLYANDFNEDQAISNNSLSGNKSRACDYQDYRKIEDELSQKKIDYTTIQFDRETFEKEKSVAYLELRSPEHCDERGNCLYVVLYKAKEKCFKQVEMGMAKFFDLKNQKDVHLRYLNENGHLELSKFRFNLKRKELESLD